MRWISDWIDAQSEVAKEFELLANKMEQAQYDRIVGYLRTGSFPSSITKNEKDSLRRKSKNFKNFVVKDGLLFYKDKKKSADLQVWILIQRL